ncbi:MAG: response regulator [Akkermansiaceae bacterium]
MDPILVINDDSKLLGEITSILKEGGYFHIAASSGEQALTQASGYDFPLVILDLKLPDMDGDELYGKLLASESHYTLPVVALVDSLDGDEVAVVNRLLPQGQVTLLSKPLKREWLEDLFARYGQKKS